MLAGLQREGESVHALLGMVVKELQRVATLARVQAQGGNLAAAFRVQGVWDSKQAGYRRAMTRHAAAHWDQVLVEVGRVDRITLDPKTYEAVVTLRIDKGFEFTKDTIASILTSGLLGEVYIGLSSGGDPQLLADGAEIRKTQSAVVLEKLISQFLFDKASAPAEAGRAAEASPVLPKAMIGDRRAASAMARACSARRCSACG